jgi:membrane protease YdiL (CAAX protease family)
VCPLLAEATVRMVHAIAPTVSLDIHPTLQALKSGPQQAWIAATLWLGATVAAPVAEEFFFRGLLQNVLAAITRRPWPAILLTATAFGAVHLSQPHTIPALIVLGLLLGFAYERTGSILVPVTIHALFNLKTLVWSALGAPVAG